MGRQHATSETEACSKVGASVCVKFGDSERRGILRGVDSYMNIALEVPEGSMVIRGDAIKAIVASEES